MLLAARVQPFPESPDLLGVVEHCPGGAFLAHFTDPISRRWVRQTLPARCVTCLHAIDAEIVQLCMEDRTTEHLDVAILQTRHLARPCYWTTVEFDTRFWFVERRLTRWPIRADRAWLESLPAFLQFFLNKRASRAALRQLAAIYRPVFQPKIDALIEHMRAFLDFRDQAQRLLLRKGLHAPLVHMVVMRL